MKEKMEIITHTTLWVKGEIIQGRIMVSIGILAVIAFVNFIDFQQSFHKGLILPFILLPLVLIGYGGFQMFIRPKQLEEIQQSVNVNSVSAVKFEIEKAKKDDQVYSILRPTWAVLFVVSLVLFFIFRNEFARGMSFGFAIWFLSAFICDSFLHHRLKTYLTVLQTI